MRQRKTAYELARSQVSTPHSVVRTFWEITSRYRGRLTSVLDLGAGDCRFASGGNYDRYVGAEIDEKRVRAAQLPANASLEHCCAFEHRGSDYAACIGNPPYVRHHDLDEKWRDRIAARLSELTEQQMNRKCNLYVYFIILGLLKAAQDGLVSMVVPYEWVSRPSAKPLRDFIIANRWHVDTFRFADAIFKGVLTTASVTVIDKRNHDGEWGYYQIDRQGKTTKLDTATGSGGEVLAYQDRGRLWALRGMSPGTQKVFTLTEGERVHAGLHHSDVFPCVTSLRGVPKSIAVLNSKSFRKRFVDAGARCWLIRSHSEEMSPRLRAYLDSVPQELRDTWTCNSRPIWYLYNLFPAPRLLASTGFTEHGPKVLLNQLGAYAVGSVCGVHGSALAGWSGVQQHLLKTNFEEQIVPHANGLKKIEIRQFNAVLNGYISEVNADDK